MVGYNERIEKSDGQAVAGPASRRSRRRTDGRVPAMVAVLSGCASRWCSRVVEVVGVESEPVVGGRVGGGWYRTVVG